MYKFVTTADGLDLVEFYAKAKIDISCVYVRNSQGEWRPTPCNTVEQLMIHLLDEHSRTDRRNDTKLLSDFCIGDPCHYVPWTAKTAPISFIDQDNNVHCQGYSTDGELGFYRESLGHWISFETVFTNFTQKSGAPCGHRDSKVPIKLPEELPDGKLGWFSADDVDGKGNIPNKATKKEKLPWWKIVWRELDYFLSMPDHIPRQYKDRKP